MERLLLALGVFSLEATGNCMVVADRELNISPRFENGRMLYFANKEDAVDFMHHLQLESPASLEVFRIGEVLTAGAFEALRV